MSIEVIKISKPYVSVNVVIFCANVIHNEKLLIKILFILFHCIILYSIVFFVSFCISLCPFVFFYIILYRFNGQVVRSSGWLSEVKKFKEIDEAKNDMGRVAEEASGKAQFDGN